jgi:hypothetical protein
MDKSDKNFKQQVAKLLKYMMGRLNIQSPPSSLKLVNDEKNAKQPWGYTGYYNPDSKQIVLFVTDRHPTDLLRSFAHELIHHWQNLNGQFSDKEKNKTDPQYAQKNSHLRKMEKQAYLLGNMVFRDFQDTQRFGDVDIANENVEEGELTKNPIGDLDYSDEDALEDEKLEKAERYFSIGQSEDSDNNYCWAWLNGKLQFKKGGTHGVNFGHDRTDKTYKGWYDTTTGMLSFVFPSNVNGNSEYDIPEKVHNALINKFHPSKIETF